MGTSFTGEVFSDRLTSCPEIGESHLSAKRHRNQKLATTLWALVMTRKDKQEGNAQMSHKKAVIIDVIKSVGEKASN